MYMSNSLNILAIVDEFTESTLSLEKDVNLIHKTSFFDYFSTPKIDLLLVESAWLGHNNAWKYKIAHYPDHPERNNTKLRKLVNWAKSKNIPTVFWNKEDPFHFDQFIDSAKLFDYIFTTDSNMIEKYKQHVQHDNVFSLGFHFQPKIHYPTPLSEIKYKSSLFIGSYNQNTHDQRRAWQDLYFSTAAPYGLTIVDRHSNSNKIFLKFPKYSNTLYLPNANYINTGKIYRDYQQSINVNTIIDSPTMFSRRLLEIMACGRLVISNPSLALQNLFPDLCEVVETQEQADELFTQLSYGLTQQQNEKIRYACDHVFTHYTVKQWLKDILNSCQIDHPYLYA